MIKHTWVFCFSFESGSGERMSMIFRGNEARSDESPAKVSTKKKKGKKERLGLCRRGLGRNMQMKATF